MELLNRDIYTGIQQVVGFSNRELPVKVSYAVGKSLVPLRVQWDLIDTEQKKVVKKYRQLDGDGEIKMKSVSPDPDVPDVPDLSDEDAAQEELDTLGLEECEIELYTITIDKFMELMDKKQCPECNGSVAVTTPNEMAALVKLGILD